MVAPWKNDKLRRAYERPEIKASVEIVLSVFTVVILLFVAIRPTLSTIASLQKRIEDQDVVNRRLSSKITQLINAQEDLSNYASRLPDLNSATPDFHDQGGLLRRIEILARENGLSINNLTVDAIPLVGGKINLADESGTETEPEREGIVASYSVSFDLSGMPDQILVFLERLERMDRLVLLTEVNMTAEEFRAAGSDSLTRGIRVIGRGKAYYILRDNQ